jgi:hypothetical protein
MGAVLPQQRTWGSGLAYFAEICGTRIILPARVAANRACNFTSNNEISCRARVKTRQTD